MLRQQTTFNQAVDVSSEDLETPEAKAWIQKHVNDEVARIAAAGARAVPLKAKNFGVLVEHDDIPTIVSKSRRRRVKVVNRIEIASGMNFDAVSQLMVSEPTDYPFRAGYQYVHVLAFTSSTNGIALLLPYVFAPFLKKGQLSVAMVDAASSGQIAEEEIVAAKKHEKDAFENNLKEWLLINEKHARARHSIKEFHSVS